MNARQITFRNKLKFNLKDLGSDKAVEASESVSNVVVPRISTEGILCKDEIWLLKVELAGRRPSYKTITCKRVEIITLNILSCK